MRRLLFAAALAVSGCFNPDQPVCAFQCGSFNEFHCPTGYTCNRGDGYCHRKDKVNEQCPFPRPDMAAVEMTIPADLASPDLHKVDDAAASDGATKMDGGATDAASTDGDTTDGASPDLAKPTDGSAAGG